eukprot:scaffold11_cov257-Pinguiococcus_pyrenoidosus.AAC.2
MSASPPLEARGRFWQERRATRACGLTPSSGYSQGQTPRPSRRASLPPSCRPLPPGAKVADPPRGDRSCLPGCPAPTKLLPPPFPALRRTPEDGETPPWGRREEALAAAQQAPRLSRTSAKTPACPHTTVATRPRTRREPSRGHLAG